MELRRITGICLLSIITLFSSIIPNTLALAREGQMQWSYDEFNDADNKGRGTVRLLYGIPETDHHQVAISCTAGTSGKTATLLLATDIGRFKDGKQVNLQFSGGGYKREIAGYVLGAKAEVGITGVQIEIEQDDELWSVLKKSNDIDYFIPGYRTSTLGLAGSKQNINRFLETCDLYWRLSNNKEAPSQQNTANEIDEKEAFENAKDLGTVQAWEAFLNNFPTGFRADLAHAYIKNKNTPTHAKPSSQPMPTPIVNSTTVDLGPGTSQWRNHNVVIDDGRLSAYAASVESHGLEFMMYCSQDQRLQAILTEKRRGVYPDFDGRVQQGLKHQQAHINFDNGNSNRVNANYQGMTGDIFFTDGFSASSRLVADIMGANRMTISAPPFQATFQLKSSRQALCSVLTRCGIVAQNCTAKKQSSPLPTLIIEPRRDSAPIIRFEQHRQEDIRSRLLGCPRGTVKLEGQCVRLNDIDEFCGRGYQRQGSKCVPRENKRHEWKHREKNRHENHRPDKKDRENNDSPCPRGMTLIFGVCVGI